MSRFELVCRPFTLELRNRFQLANSTRTTTPTLLVELHGEGIVGYGEAAMPPYLGETHATAQAFLTRVDLAWLAQPFDRRTALHRIDALAPRNHAAKAAIDIALHDWLGKKLGQPHWRLCGLDPKTTPTTSFTLAIDTPDKLRERAAEAAKTYRALKIKLGSEHDRAMITAIRAGAGSDCTLRVDVNQGWRDRDHAAREIEWLAQRGVELVEQPMPKEACDDTAWLQERSPVPLIADEAVQRLSDVAAARGIYAGINIKLMKCTGLHEAYDMLVTARALGLKVMLGCMTESSCGIAAAAQLASLCDFADLDGAHLVRNDPFEPLPFVDGCVLPTERPGIGVTPRAS
ncbi:MAG: dipeptide epimerase [Planctomycetota bacterium]